MPLPRGSPSPGPVNWNIRPFAETDRAALLRLNGDNWPSVYPLDEDLLAWLRGFGGHHRVAVDPAGVVLGYLMTFSSASAYDDTEIRELRRRVAEPFLYICQVAIAPEHRRRRIGCAFYEAATDAAQRQGLRLLCCDVNTDPPNPESFAFHRRLGFLEIGQGIASNGVAIAYLTRKL